MNKYCIYPVLVMCAGLTAGYAHAYTGECVREGGNPANITVDIGDIGVKAPSDNDVGKVVVNGSEFKASGIPYRASCDIPKTQSTSVYITTTVPLSVTKDNGSNGTWYGLNEYLSMRSSTFVGGMRDEWVWNPMKSESNRYDQKNGNVTDWRTGGKVRLSIKIDKKFIGFSPFDKLVLTGYGNALHDGVSTTPLFNVYLKGAIDVPQSCDLDAGTTVSMDFGNVGASLFSQAGAGNKPAGVNPETHTIAVKCKNIDAQALLSMRLETDNVSGNAMVSDNKDVGFIVAGSDKIALTPNNIDSKIKFQLDDNSAASVPITAWPVSITGNKPAEGKFTAEGYLRIDFD